MLRSGGTVLRSGGTVLRSGGTVLRSGGTVLSGSTVLRSGGTVLRSGGTVLRSFDFLLFIVRPHCFICWIMLHELNLFRSAAGGGGWGKERKSSEPYES